MKVLIADDNRDAVATFAALVRTWGFEPCIAYDGLSALALLRGPEPPPLALLDWIMPGLSGIEICREIRSEPDRPYTYFILVTGCGNRAEMVEGLSAGADEFLFKPVDPDELHARLLAGKRVLDLQDQLLATMGQLKQQATHDALTGIWNRAAILEHLDRELARGLRHNQHIAAVMCDLDHFKVINDTYGHLAGDQVLFQASKRLRDALRPYDAIGRYGGEEFLLVFSNCDRRTAQALAERLRTCIAAQPFDVFGKHIPVTSSLGISTWDGKGAAADLLHQADEALYRAKHAGRNRVMVADAATKLES